MIVLRDRGAVAEFTLGVLGENSQITTHTSLSGIAQVVFREWCLLKESC
jgi:hypothetical protein